MREETLRNKFGNVTERDKQRIRAVNAALEKAERDGMQVNETALLSLISRLRRDPRRTKELRTAMALWESMDSNGKVHPKYDLFREGRGPIYVVKPNLNGNVPKEIFDEVLVPLTLNKSKPLQAVNQISEALSKGMKVGPIIGDSMYLRVV